MNPFPSKVDLGALSEISETGVTPDFFHFYKVKIPFAISPPDGKLTAGDRGYVERGGICETEREAKEKLKEAARECQSTIAEIQGEIEANNRKIK